MRERKHKATQMELEVPVILTADQYANEAFRLAEKVAIRDGLHDDLRTEVKRRRREIRGVEGEISNIARALREGAHNRRQGDLFHGEAERALHDVHARAEGTNGAGPTDEVREERDPVAELAGSLAGDEPPVVDEDGRRLDPRGSDESSEVPPATRSHSKRRPTGPLARASRKAKPKRVREARA